MLIASIGIFTWAKKTIQTIDLHKIKHTKLNPEKYFFGKQS